MFHFTRSACRRGRRRIAGPERRGIRILHRCWHGSGSATAGSTTPVTIAQTNTLAALYPGTAEGVDLAITNPGSAPRMSARCTLSASPLTRAQRVCRDRVGQRARIHDGRRFGQRQDRPQRHSVEDRVAAMNDTSFNQDTCQGATLTLAFSSN